MFVRPIKTRIFRENESLVEFITQHVPRLKNGSILAVTSKVVGLAEGRTANIRDLKSIIRRESDWTLRARYGDLTLRDGLLMWNAGADESNADGKLALLPKDSFKSAAHIRRALIRKFDISNLGVVVTDSRIMPLRAGVVGVALGYAGFKGLRDYRGKPDIFGRKLKYTQTDIADALATSAVLAMGEGNERQPLAIIDDAPVEFCERVDRKDLVIPFKDDMYRPLFRRIPRSERRR